MPLTYDKCCAVILAGGQSTRMGSCKALLPVNEKPMIHHLYEQLSAFSDCKLSSNDPNIDKSLPVPVIQDVYKGCGPIGGIHAALTNTEKDVLFIVPCDLPYFSAELPHQMLTAFQQEMDVMVCRDHTGRIHPLCGIYRKKVFPVVEAHIQAGDYRMTSLLSNLHCSYFEVEKYMSENVLYNMNTQQDYHDYIQNFGKNPILKSKTR